MPAKMYTVKQIEKYKKRMWQQHNKELVQAKHDAYMKGKKDGMAELQKAIRQLFFAPEEDTWI